MQLLSFVKGPSFPAGSGGLEAVGSGPGARLEGTPQRQADLVPLRVAVQRAGSQAERARAQDTLDAELSRRRSADRAVRQVVAEMLRQPEVAQLLMVRMDVWTPRGSGHHRDT